MHLYNTVNVCLILDINDLPLRLYVTLSTAVLPTKPAHCWTNTKHSLKLQGCVWLELCLRRNTIHKVQQEQEYESVVATLRMKVSPRISRSFVYGR